MSWTIPWSPTYTLTVEVAWGAALTDATGAGWTWTDITADVRTDSGITIQNGRQDEQSVSAPASCKVVLSNPAGRYLTGPGPNYPYVRRNVPVRVRLNSAVLFQGYATSWTPTFDLGGDNPTVALTANGVLRRLGQGTGTPRSPMARYLSRRSDLVEWWPLEDPAESVIGLSALPGGTGMTYMPGSTSAAKVTSSDEAPSGADRSVTLVQGAGLSGAIRQTSGAAWAVGFSVWLDQTVTADRSLRIDMAGTIGAYLIVTLFSNSVGVVGWRINAYSSAIPGGEVWNGPQLVTDRDWTTGQGRWVHFVLSTDGTNLYMGALPDPIDAARPTYSQNYTPVRLTVPITKPTRVEVDSIDGSDMEVRFSHIFVTNTYTSAGVASNPSPQAGYFGELASARVQRLCAEENLAVTVMGGTSTSGSLPMGAQPTASVLECLREAEGVEQGVLYDGLGPGLTWVPKRELESPTIDITMAATQVVEPFGPVDDDQRLRNTITASRPQGAEITYQDVTGPAGTNTVGIYADSVEVNAQSDGDARDYAAWSVYLGTQVGYRWPSVGVDYRAVPTLLANIADLLEPGNRLTVTGPAAVLPGVQAEDLLLHIEGVKLTITPGTWRSELACSQAAPWNVAVIPAQTGYTGTDAARAASDGTTVTSARTPGQTSLPISTPAGPVWTTTADDYPLLLNVGGYKVRATACSGTGTAQTMTVDALTVSIPSGSAVDLWNQPVLAL